MDHPHDRLIARSSFLTESPQGSRPCPRRLTGAIFFLAFLSSPEGFAALLCRSTLLFGRKCLGIDHKQVYPVGLLGDDATGLEGWVFYKAELRCQSMRCNREQSGTVKTPFNISFWRTDQLE